MWLRLVNYSMAKKMKMWDVLQTVYLSGCKEKSKAHEAFELAAQNTSDDYARGPCVAALDAVQISDHTKSEAVIPDNKERVPQFKEWKESRNSNSGSPCLRSRNPRLVWQRYSGDIGTTRT